MEESFKALCEKVVSFMVNFMVEIYDKLDRKNADKVYNIVFKESVDCFSIQLHSINPHYRPLSPPVEMSVSQVDISKAQNKPKKPPITQKLAAPRSRKPQNGSKNEFRATNQHDHVLRSNAWSCFSFRATHQHEHVLRSNAWSCFSFRTINHMTMSFVVMLGHVYFSGMRPVGPGCVSGQNTLLKVAQY